MSGSFHSPVPLIAEPGILSNSILSENEPHSLARAIMIPTMNKVFSLLAIATVAFCSITFTVSCGKDENQSLPLVEENLFYSIFKEKIIKKLCFFYILQSIIS